MIYISSACVQHEKIKDVIKELANNGFKNIELSGGTKYYEGYEDDIVALRNKYGLNYLLHNYFPPPAEDFMLNLASLNDDIYQRTLKHYEKAITLSQKLDLKKFGFHAGFLIDFKVSEVGGEISYTKLYDRDRALKRFCEGYHYLKEKAEGVELYIENNVLSSTNTEIFQSQNPFMLTDYHGYTELKGLVDFKLLLDIGHLNISANSLKLDFAEQLNKMIAISDYVHLSDNDGLRDQNRCFHNDSQMLNILKSYDLHNKTVTLEIYGDISEIKSSQLALERSLCLG
ncbi:MAG: sugar phosphate isomerase/epimerase [Candidatus Omnitrophica bacterium]|nr:sugar phosphate isomerase/epimerase [Candidatus Omnitrophota bacterium]